jgi:excisionase family DNA binding protein
MLYAKFRLDYIHISFICYLLKDTTRYILVSPIRYYHRTKQLSRGGKNMTDKGEKLTISVETAGQLLGLSRNSAYQGVHTGEIPAVKVGKRYLIPRKALQKMLEAGKS